MENRTFIGNWIESNNATATLLPTIHVSVHICALANIIINETTGNESSFSSVDCVVRFRLRFRSISFVRFATNKSLCNGFSFLDLQRTLHLCQQAHTECAINFDAIYFRCRQSAKISAKLQKFYFLHLLLWRLLHLFVIFVDADRIVVFALLLPFCCVFPFWIDERLCYI